jgi:hypothetical protein
MHDAILILQKHTWIFKHLKEEIKKYFEYINNGNSNLLYGKTFDITENTCECHKNYYLYYLYHIVSKTISAIDLLYLLSHVS